MTKFAFILTLLIMSTAQAAPYCSAPPNATACLSHGLAPSFHHQTQLWGYVDQQGNTVLTPRYEKARSFQENLAAVAIAGKFGFIDKTGRVVIAPQYDAVGDFSQGLAAVIQNNKLGYIDKNGRLAIAMNYQADGNLIELHQFRESLAAVKRNNQWGFISPSGGTVIPFRYEEVGLFHQGLAKVVQNNKLGFIDRTGKMRINPQYDRPTPDGLLTGFNHGVATVKYENKFGVIDENGKIIVPFGKYPFIGEYHESLAVFADQNGKYGYISHTGEIMLPAEYDMAYDFSDYGVVENWALEERLRVDKHSLP